MSDDVICPECGSSDIAEILWGLPAFSDELEAEIEAGHVFLGGCIVSDFDPDWRCNACGCEFGRNPEAYANWKEERKNQLKAVVYGAAVGDALGVPYEFRERDTFECTGMTGGGAHGMPLGTFSDDTSMMLATCDSIRACGGIDVDDMRKRFKAWLDEGAYTPDGVVFDVGNTTATALRQGHGCDGERSNGNGSLMRIAPLAFTSATDDQIREVSAITHAHPISQEACVAFVHILRDVIRGRCVPFVDRIPDGKSFAHLKGIEDTPRAEVRSSGYVVDTLGASLWCALNSWSYEEAVLAAVNLGGDSDTTACVTGALAGIEYGFRNIPDEWIETLRGKDVIESCLF